MTKGENASLQKKGNLHDLFFREVYSKKKYALELFRLLFTEEEYSCFDWKELKAELTSFIDGEHREKRADLVFSVSVKESKLPVKIVFLLEHKSYQDKELLLQLLYYQSQLYAKFPHSFVIPIVIYHGKKKEWKISKDFQSYSLEKYPQKLSKSLKKNAINFSYRLLNVQELDMRKAAGLTTSPILFILKNIWNLNKKILGEFFRKTSKLKKEDKCFLLEAATYYIHKKDKSFNKEVLEEIEEKTVEKGEGAMSLIKMAREEAREEAIKEGRAAGRAAGRAEGMERGMEKGMEKGVEKGKAEGRAEGMERGMEAVALRMLEKGVEIKNICIFTELSEEKVLQLKESFRKL